MPSILLLLSYLTSFPLSKYASSFKRHLTTVFRLFFTKQYKKLYKWKDYATAQRFFVLTLEDVKKVRILTFL